MKRPSTMLGTLSLWFEYPPFDWTQGRSALRLSTGGELVEPHHRERAERSKGRDRSCAAPFRLTASSDCLTVAGVFAAAQDRMEISAMAEALDEVIQLARKMEMDGVEHYRRAAEATTNPQGKRLFESFARDEERHLRIVEDIARGIGVDVDAMPMPRDEIRTVFSQADAPAETPGGVTAGERVAIQIAMRMEQKSYKLYKDAANTAGDEKQKVVFDRLAQEENQHYEILENTLQYLTDNRKWFLWNESGLLTGDMTSLGG